MILLRHNERETGKSSLNIWRYFMTKTKNIVYLSDEEIAKLNYYEKDHKKVSYRTLLNKLNINVILCNAISEIDESIYDNIETGSVYDEDTGEYIDIYQYYITDINNWDMEYIKKYYNNEFIIAYSEKLELYVLMVDHCGTSWDYVLTDVEYSNNWDKVSKRHQRQEQSYEDKK
jgi:hypothetical protein